MRCIDLALTFSRDSPDHLISPSSLFHIHYLHSLFPQESFVISLKHFLSRTNQKITRTKRFISYATQCTVLRAKKRRELLDPIIYFPQYASVTSRRSNTALLNIYCCLPLSRMRLFHGKRRI